MKIFLVEDAAIIVQVLTRALADLHGIELCGHAGRVQEALVRIAQHQPDLVILDLSLEDGSGLEVLHQVRKRKPRLPVIVFTNDSARRAHCRHAGADYFFDKSTEFSELLATLKRLRWEFPAS